jgi:hypothetical protein
MTVLGGRHEPVARLASKCDAVDRPLMLELGLICLLHSSYSTDGTSRSRWRTDFASDLVEVPQNNGSI